MTDKANEPTIEEQFEAGRHGWLPISRFQLPDQDTLWKNGSPCVLVDNGIRVGEAKVSEDYDAWDGESEDIPYRWAWTHHSTCSCCHSFMDPQPLYWQPLPEPAIPRNPE